MKQKSKQSIPKKPFQVIGKNKEAFEKFKTIFEDVGAWNINYFDWSKELGVPNQTVYYWKDKLLEESPLINPAKFGNKMIAATEAAIKQCQLKIRTAKTDSDRAKFMNVLCNLNSNLTDIYEKFGHKEKVAEKHLIFGSSGITVKFLDPESPEDKKDEAKNEH
jgi:predicted transcriptional regulator